MNQSLVEKYFSNSPEFSCLLRAMQLENIEDIDQQLFNLINWPNLITLAEEHGLAPLLYRYLKDNHMETSPADALTDLEHRYKANELRNRVVTQELLIVMTLFKEKGIAALAYKGPSLTLSVYGDLALRQFGDLDILIPANDVLRACQELINMGYIRTIPQLSVIKEKDFIRTDHEHEFVSADELINIDLHWGLSTQRFPFYMQTDSLFGRAENLVLARGTVDQISAQDLLLLLCMHSNKDLWRKLVWACDIDRLIRSRNDINWQSLVEQAIESRCERMLYISLFISHALLNTPLPTSILEILQAPLYQRLAESAMELCKQNTEVIGFKQCLSIHPYIMSICDDRTDRYKYILRSIVTPNENDMMQYNLPSWLHWLYYIIRPVKNLARCTARSIKHIFTK